ncbi:hypothetical protein NC653_010384 [Populus alba x Populus x berolinensis]|uniref:S-locus receptor kinase C-terminal domain-containing protein n=1 Tax=Populus alba x Populus x berolinensis TaxID=444605 RepID=A0AAD6W569_9ROSI|nr:hypothetical protein NC653_010384 [Populus alba x Populus x berolinensis]
MKSWEVYTGRRGFQNKILFVSFWPPVWKTTYLKRISRHVIIFLFPFGLFNTLLLNFTVHHGPQILQTSASSSRLTFSSKARALPAPSSEPSTPASIGSQEVQRPPRNAASPSSQQRSNGISGVVELASGLRISQGNEITLPSPTKPAFVLRTRSGQDLPAMSRRAACSVNEVTVTMVAAR